MGPSEPKFFPALCPRGHRAFLAEIQSSGGTGARCLCPSCGAEARLIPGAYYTAATRARFDRVSAVINAVVLRRDRASTMASELDLAARRGSAEAFEGALEQLPELSGLRPLWPEQPREQHAFIGLVIALLDAYAAPASGPLSPPPFERDVSAHE